MRKLLIIGVVALLVLSLAAFLAVRSVLTTYLTPDYLVSQLETAFNCRADISELDLKLWRKPSKIELINVTLAPRDEFAARGVPLAERPPLGETAMHCESVVLEARLADLLFRKLTVDRLVFQSFKAQVLLNEDGTNSFESIFSAPEFIDPDTGAPPVQADAGAATAPPPAGTAAVPATQLAPGEAAGEAGKTFHASDIPLATFAKIVEINGGMIHAKVAKNGSSILIDNIQLTATDIDIDPGDLANHNAASVSLSALLGVDSRPEEGKRFVELQLEGRGTIIPFNAGSGMLDPRLVSDLTILEGSYIDTLPTLDSLAGLFEKLKDVGINLGDVDLRGDFTGSATTKIEYYAGNVKTIEETNLPLHGHHLKLIPGSWINANSNEHLLEGTVVVSEEKTAEAIEEVDKFLKEKAAFLATPEIRDTVMKPVMVDGRITLGFRSHGQLNQPQVDLITEIGTISDILKLQDTGKKVLKDIKKMFGF